MDGASTGPSLVKGPTFSRLLATQATSSILTTWTDHPLWPSALGWLSHHEDFTIICPPSVFQQKSRRATRPKRMCTKHVACLCDALFVPTNPDRSVVNCTRRIFQSPHTGYKSPVLQSVALHHAANLFFLPVPPVPSTPNGELSIFSSPLPSPLGRPAGLAEVCSGGGARPKGCLKSNPSLMECERTTQILSLALSLSPPFTYTHTSWEVQYLTLHLYVIVTEHLSLAGNLFRSSPDETRIIQNSALDVWGLYWGKHATFARITKHLEKKTFKSDPTLADSKDLQTQIASCHDFFSWAHWLIWLIWLTWSFFIQCHFTWKLHSRVGRTGILTLDSEDRPSVPYRNFYSGSELSFVKKTGSVYHVPKPLPHTPR